MTLISDNPLLPEQPDERRMFDMHVQTLGGPLPAVINYLSVLALTLAGSDGAQCAIMHNALVKIMDET